MLHIPVTGRQSDTIRGNIYRRLYFSNDQHTKQSLARDCGISMPTLYQNLSELMESGLVDYSGEDLSTGGRRARGLCIVSASRSAVGISVSAHHLRMVAIDLRLHELAYQKIPFDYFAMGGNRAETVASQLEQFLNEHHIDRGQLLGVGLSFPGIVSADCSQIEISPTLRLHHEPLSELMEAIPYPVYAANDASCSGYAEWFVRGDGTDIAYLSLENGVGGFLLIGGSPYDGGNRRSAEFGHICVQPAGLPCSCGKHGCLEAYCSVRRIREETGVSLEEFFRRVRFHDPECETLWYDILRRLATGINTIRMITDCDIVLGGLLTEFLPPYLPALKRYVLAGNPFDQDAEFVQLSVLRRHIAPVGAALYFVREFIETM